MAYVTCHTEGCGNAGIAIPIALTATDPDGNTVSVDAVCCGVCGGLIDDVTEDERL